MKTNIKQKDFIFMSQRQRVSPFPNYFSMETMVNEMKKFTGKKLDRVLNFWQGNVMFAFPHRRSYNQGGQVLTKKIISSPEFPVDLVTKQKKFGQALIEFTKKANQEVSNKISNKRLGQLFVEYEKKYKLVYATYGWVWVAEDFFAAELLKIVEKKVKNPPKAADILNVLTKEPTAMVALQERKALLELGLKINKTRNWQNNKKAQRLIDKHVKNYFWVTRDYEDSVITQTEVIERLKKLFKKDIKKPQQKLIQSLQETEKLRKDYLKDFNFSPKETQLFAAMRKVAYLKELRKTYVSQSLFYFDKILEEIAKRLYLSVKQVRFMKTSEVQAALIKAQDFTQELNSRLKISVWHTTQKGTEVIIGKPAETLFNIFCKVDKNTQEFQGLPVSPGKAKGPVKIIMNPNEVNKVKKGDIIVTVQVVPSFSTAIIKSAGLVCDGGHGITSHPATLAREAGIPCVIQTRFAREVLKNGDIVEVDGYKGIVKKYKSPLPPLRKGE